MITLSVIIVALLIILIGIPIALVVIDLLVGIGVILIPTIVIGKELIIMLIAGIVLFCIAKRKKML